MTADAPDFERLRSIKTLPQLIAYLRDELGWPIDSDDLDDVTYDYDPSELGFDAATSARIKEIKQLRPLVTGQPWGVFWVNFEKKRLPVVVLRRALANLGIKKRPSASRADRPAWNPNDLLFISAYGEEHDRAITFAHFSQDLDSPTDLPVLKVLGWDDENSVLHLADAHEQLIDSLSWPDDPSDIGVWRTKWGEAFTTKHGEIISSTKESVKELADLAKRIRKRANSVLARETSRGPMRRLCNAFRETLIHDLKDDDFADVITQTVSYGLLAAKFSRSGAITVQNLVDMIPRTNPFLRELLSMFLVVAGRKRNFDFDELGIQDVIDLLNRVDSEAVKADFGDRTKGEDPVVHFYEHFLAAYDKQKKVKRGVFFTPQPVVSYIVRSVHELLQTEFGIEDGLASTITWGEMVSRNQELKIPEGTAKDEFFVTVLDPATGTATFLVEVIEVVFVHLKKKWEEKGADAMPRLPAQQSPRSSSTFAHYWDAYVPAALLPRLFGYELMVAPYAIAHMKLGLKFSEINSRLGRKDYRQEFKGRANVYLTNSLEPPSDIQSRLAGIFPALAHEATAVNEVKHKKRFTVVIGNPPYSKMSSNWNEWIDGLLHGKGSEVGFANYYMVDGKSLGERTVWIQDDYIKFIRLSQWHIDRAGTGIHAYISNNGYLDNPTLRGMRQQLKRSFCNIYVLNLHGSTRRGERGQEETRDQNVFDIQQGVAIGVFVKRSSESPATVCHADLWGDRETKYRTLGAQEVTSLRWTPVHSSPPFHLFVPTDSAYQAEYDTGWKVTDIFSMYHCGIITKRDSLTIHWTANDVVRTVSDFVALTPEAAREKYGLPADVRDWKVKWAQADLRKAGLSRDRVIPVLYRPFDVRFTYFTGCSRGFVGWPVADMTKLMLPGDNIALITTRMTKGEDFGHALVSRQMAEVICLSAKTSNNGFVFPLYSSSSAVHGPLFKEQKTRGLSQTQEANLNPSFCKRLSEGLTAEVLPQGSGDVNRTFSPEDVFSYIIALLQCPSYRARYREFLSRDFPRIPVSGSLRLFRALARLGGELVALHLMESPKLNEFITNWHGETPSREIEKISYADETVWIDKGKTEGFIGVPEEVWNFHIGGYQVCEKWLKDRKGRRLSAEDIQHYQKIVVALNETIRIMGEIDKVIEEHGGWPIR